MIHGYPAFFQAQNPDVVLRVIYSIGYMNLFASRVLSLAFAPS